MTTVSGNLTAEGASAVLALGNVNEDIYLTITGPFDGTLALEKALTPDESSWEVIAGPWSGAASVAINKRVNKKDKLRVRAKDIPDNAITDGTFEADTEWTAGSGWEITGGEAVATTASTDLEQTIATGLVEGASYSVAFTATRSAGSVTVKIGGTSGTARSSSATFTETIVAGSGQLIEFTGSGFSGTIDDVTLTPVIAYSLNDTDAILEEVRDPDGVVQITRKQSGYTFPQGITADVTGDVTGAVTGAINSVPVAESQAADPSQKCTFFDDFLGDLLKDELISGVGGGTGNAVALIAGSQGGAVQIKTSSADAADTANISSLGLGALSFRADAGGLVMEARLQIDAITAVAVFIGFTDVLNSTIEMPIFLLAADIDSTATNACGVLFDTDATTDQWCHGGVKADVDTVPAFSGAAPAAATYYTVRVEVSAAGAVQGFIDDVAIGAPVANAVTITTPLCPVIVANNRGAAARNVLVDYLWVQQNR
jgi:hypothetical protein